MANKKVLTINGKVLKINSNVLTASASAPTELDYLCFTAKEANSTVELCKYGSPSIANTAYSRDGITWTAFAPSTTAGANTVTLTNIGDKVYFRNDITANFAATKYLKFIMSGKIAASGNCNSIYSSTDFKSLDKLAYTWCYRRLFLNCTSLTTAPALPTTTLPSGCYFQMFSGCTNLTIVPALPATAFGATSYSYMFQGCTSLQVSDTQTTEAQHEWRIPTSGTFKVSFQQSGMFENCLGTRSSDTLPVTLESYTTYYTQNQPV